MKWHANSKRNEIGKYDTVALPVCTRSSQSRPAKGYFKYSIKNRFLYILFITFIWFCLHLFLSPVHHRVYAQTKSKMERATEIKLKIKRKVPKLTSYLNEIKIINSTFHCQIVQRKIDNGWNSWCCICYFLMPSYIRICNAIYQCRSHL